MVMRMEFLIILLLWSFKAFAQPLNKTCPSSCGSVSIDYPFGIGADCYLDSSFSIDCNQSFQPPKPFLLSLDLEVLKISVENSTIRVNYPTFSSCNDTFNKVNVSLGASNFFFPDSRNIFVERSCEDLAQIEAGDYFLDPPNICLVVNGLNCCKTTIPPGIDAFITYMHTTDLNNTNGSCKSVFLVEEEWFQSVKTSHYRSHFPVELGWRISETSFKSLNITYKKTLSSPNMFPSKQFEPSSLYECSYQLSVDRSLTFTCSCQRGFGGNPYISDGCKDIDECTIYNPCLDMKGSFCKNVYGSFYCYSSNKSHMRVLTIGLSTSLGLLVLLIGGWSSYKVVKKRLRIKQKKKFFKRNGGLLLQQKLSSDEANVETTKFFSSKDLEIATDHFNVNRILGQGAQGIVYKGMLIDGRIVAVKKSKVIDEEKLQEFINEVIILSQINHRNVVKLIGCCLEIEVPLLVYEYVPNGTLSQYLRNQSEDFLLTWDMRLRIATDVAGALCYLHSATSSPIFHRDIKSTNILLDDKYRAKVADFGTSRSITIDQTHLTTLVHGTFGYLDPEYFQSSQFTEKSDVYSYGVVLAELLTGEKAISSTRTNKSLATYFIQSIEENKLFDILDSHVLKEDKKEEMIVVANLAKRCLSLNGKKRPTMKEIAVELEAIQICQKGLNTLQNPEELEYIKIELDRPSYVSTTSTFGVDGSTSSSKDTHSLLFSSISMENLFASIC